MEFTVTKQYLVVSRDYVDDGSYDEDIIGATGDLTIANCRELESMLYSISLVTKKFLTYKKE